MPRIIALFEYDSEFDEAGGSPRLLGRTAQPDLVNAVAEFIAAKQRRTLARIVEAPGRRDAGPRVA